MPAKYTIEKATADVKQLEDKIAVRLIVYPISRDTFDGWFAYSHGLLASLEALTIKMRKFTGEI